MAAEGVVQCKEKRFGCKKSSNSKGKESHEGYLSFPGSCAHSGSGENEGQEGHLAFLDRHLHDSELESGLKNNGDSCTSAVPPNEAELKWYAFAWLENARNAKVSDSQVNASTWLEAATKYQKKLRLETARNAKIAFTQPNGSTWLEAATQNQEKLRKENVNLHLTPKKNRYESIRTFCIANRIPFVPQLAMDVSVQNL